MSTTRRPTDKATIRRFRDAVNAGDRQLISEAIDEIVERAWHQRIGPRPRMTIANTGRQR